MKQLFAPIKHRIIAALLCLALLGGTLAVDLSVSYQSSEDVMALMDDETEYENAPENNMDEHMPDDKLEGDSTDNGIPEEPIGKTSEDIMPDDMAEPLIFEASTDDLTVTVTVTDSDLSDGCKLNIISEYRVCLFVIQAWTKTV